MARPRTDGVTVREVPGRARPWGCFWRASTTNEDRVTRTKFFATEAEAQAFAADVGAEFATTAPPVVAPVVPQQRAAARRLEHAAPGTLTFQELADDWLDTIIRRRKPSTQRSYREILTNHVYPTLGRVRVSHDTFTAQHLVRLLAARQKAGVSWGTQKAILRVVSSALGWAVLYRHLAGNPAYKLTKALKDDSNADFSDPEPNPLAPADCDAFLAWLQTGKVPDHPTTRPVDGPKLRGGTLRSSGYPEWFPYFQFLARTGCRRGEAGALKWSTVYLDRTPPRARLERSYSPSAGDDVTLKGKVAHDIDLAAGVVTTLRELARTRRAVALKAGRPVSPYVFVGVNGGRQLPDSSTAERVFEAGMVALGLAHEQHTIHDLRDTFATSHLTQDPSRLFWVSWMLGHKQQSTTLNRYAKWVPTLAAGATFASALDRL